MFLSFSKYQGHGNDFILIDDRKGLFPLKDPTLIRRLCDRHFGIGADGLIVCQSSQRAHARMRIFNSDGGEASMCGNGLRCFILFLGDLDVLEERYLIETQTALIPCWREGALVSSSYPSAKVLHWGLGLRDKNPLEAFVVDVGVMHAVVFVEDLKNYPVEEVGQYIRFHMKFEPEGVNVNFVEVKSSNLIEVRTYERGVEAETLACGTGSAAAAFVAMKHKSLTAPIRVLSQSGQSIEVTFKGPEGAESIEVRGAAHFVFKGSLEL